MRSSRKSVKKSKINDFISKSVKNIKTNKTTVLTIAGFLVGFLFLGIFIYSNVKKINESASISLTHAYIAISSGDINRAISLLDETISGYKSSPSAYIARLLKADYLIEGKEFDEALILLNQSYKKAKPSTLKPLALVRIIYLYDQQKDYENAIRFSNEFIKKYKKHFYVKNIYLNLAEYYLVTGLQDDAIRVYTEIAMQYPASEEAHIATINIEALNK